MFSSLIDFVKYRLTIILNLKQNIIQIMCQLYSTPCSINKTTTCTILILYNISLAFIFAPLTII